MATREEWLESRRIVNDQRVKAREERERLQRKLQDLVEMSQEDLKQALLKGDVRTALQLGFRLGEFFGEDGSSKVYKGLHQFPQKYLDKLAKYEEHEPLPHEVAKVRRKIQNARRHEKRIGLILKYECICPRCKEHVPDPNQWIVKAWRRGKSASWRPMCRKCYDKFLEGTKRKPPHRPRAGAVPADLKCPECKRQYKNPARRFWCVTQTPVVCWRCGKNKAKESCSSQTKVYPTLVEILAMIRKKTDKFAHTRDPFKRLLSLWRYARNTCTVCGELPRMCDDCKTLLNYLPLVRNMHGPHMSMHKLQKRVGVREAQEQLAALEAAFAKEQQ